ncbi:MAG: cupin domain-containing protein [Anaerolineae bacterium]|nr:cupin domain-containing protein [Anaerolineae bacterium]
MFRFNETFLTTDADVETLVFDWGVVRMLSEEKVTGSKSVSFGHVLLNPGKGHERHNHPDADEIIYFIKGEGMQMLDDGEPVHCTGGECCWIPRGVYHSTINSGGGVLELVVAYMPAGAEQILRTLPGVRIVPAGQPV